jgi:multidrug efflux system outer membrane protein
VKKYIMLCALLAGGCTVGPDYHKPDVTVPDSYRGLEGVPTAPQADLSRWWTGFHDAELESLVARALKSNLDIMTAVSRVREARQQEIIAGAAELPQVSASAVAARLHSSTNPLGSLGGASSGNGAQSSGGTDIKLYSLGFDASWEVDIFGGGRRGIEAANASAEAALWQMRDGEVTLTAEIAADYFSLRATQARLAILNDQLTRQNDTLKLVAARARTGFVTELDVNQQKTQTDNTAAQIPDLEAQARVLEHAIAILLAVEPDALASELESSQPIPLMPAALPASLPSELLARRPDVRAAERQLAAATADIGVATADLYPKFNLLGGITLVSNHLSSLLSPDSLGELGLGMIQWPIFNAGKTHANIGAKTEERDQAYYAYQKAVLGAVKDAEDALVRTLTDQRRIDVLTTAQGSAQSSTNIALSQYRAGLVTYVNVLTAQTALLNTQDQLEQARQSQAADLVSVYKALGGGWGAAYEP